MKIKNTISKQLQETDNLSPQLESLRREESGYKVPDGYFDALSPRIIDRINEKDHKVLSKSGILVFRKPVVWAPIMVVAIAAVLLIFIVPSQNNQIIPAYDELADINMAYDASYAEEVLLAESYSRDKEIEVAVSTIPATTTINENSDLSEDLIEEYLKDQDIEIEILIEY
jgi:hypothetical protein